MAITETFKALGDPIRLEIIQRLSTGSLYTLSSMSEDFGLTRQGMRKHVQVLVDAGLVNIQPIGRNKRITFVPESLTDASTYIEQLERKWEARLEALKVYVERD